MSGTNKSQKTRKRIVSKGEYVAVQTSRTLLRVSALLSILEIALCVFLTVSLPFYGFGLIGWVAALFSGVMAYRLGKARLIKLRVRAGIEEVLPLTRANAAQLPEVEILARASSQPPQEQQNILLRAVMSNQETPANQLLRAAEGHVAPADQPVSDSLTHSSEERVPELQRVLHTVTPDLEPSDEQVVSIAGGR